MKKLLKTGFCCIMLLASSAMATTFGPVENFDVVNDDPQGRTAHGFEIVMHGIQPSDITSIFGDANRWTGMERYGLPEVSTVGDATVVTYRAQYSNGWSVGTASGQLQTAPADSCWPLGDPNYNTSSYPCDHFGVSTSTVATSVEYNWLFEGTPGQLVQTPAQVPAPIWNVIPQPPIQPAPVNGVVQAPIPQPPVVEVKIRAPEPQALEFGEPQWVKVTATGVQNKVEVGDLVQNNKIVKDAKKQVQVEWQLIQTDAGNPAAGNVDLSGVKLDNNVQSVVYTFEYYDYTGRLDPETGEALPNGSDTPNQPDPADLGNFKVIQMAAVNLDGAIAPAPAPAPIAPAIDSAIVDGVIGVPYSQVVNVTPGQVGDSIDVTVTGLPASLTFDKATNTISGTPDFVGLNNQISIQAKDLSNGTTTSITTSFNVYGVGINFSPVFPDATVGQSYSYQLTSTGGYGPITYSVTPLPDGLTLVGDMITGTPTTAQTYTVSYDASDAYGDQATGTPVPFVVNPPAVLACSGTGEKITSISPRQGFLATDKGLNYVKYPDQAHTTLAPGLNTFAIGNLISYTGSIDAAGVFCVADTMSVWTPLNVVTPTFVKGTVGIAYTVTPITITGGWTPYTSVVSGLPDGLTFNGSVISGTPTKDGTFPIAISVTDDKGNSFNITTGLSIVIDKAPVVAPASCTAPIGAKSWTDIHAKITAVSGKTLTIGNKSVTVLDCAKVSWKGTAKSYVVGYDADANKGYILNGVNYATNIIVDNGK